MYYGRDGYAVKFKYDSQWRRWVSSFLSLDVAIRRSLILLTMNQLLPYIDILVIVSLVYSAGESIHTLYKKVPRTTIAEVILAAELMCDEAVYVFSVYQAVTISSKIHVNCVFVFTQLVKNCVIENLLREILIAVSYMTKSAKLAAEMNRLTQHEYDVLRDSTFATTE